MKVVNIRHDVSTHYIGRYSSHLPKYGINAHLGNPFPVYIGRTRGESITYFEKWAREQDDVLARIKALPRDAILGCFCKPLPCHGDVIVKLWKEMHNA